MTERKRLIQGAEEMPLGELALKVLRKSFIPGLHDVVLLKRCASSEGKDR